MTINGSVKLNPEEISQIVFAYASQLVYYGCIKSRTTKTHRESSMNRELTQNAIILARKHLGKGTMESSARLCLSDAIELYDSGELEYAHHRALKSIAYSVGQFHPDYPKAS
jgi:hypothetical protein